MKLNKEAFLKEANDVSALLNPKVFIIQRFLEVATLEEIQDVWDLLIEFKEFINRYDYGVKND